MKKLLAAAVFLSSTAFAKDFKPEDNLLPISHIDYECTKNPLTEEDPMIVGINTFAQPNEMYIGVVAFKNKVKKTNYLLNVPVTQSALARCVHCMTLTIRPGEGPETVNFNLFSKFTGGEVKIFGQVEDSGKLLNFNCEKV